METASQSRRSVASIVRELDESILASTSLGPAVFNELLNAQRELGLLHGDRPTCPFLRPHIIARSQYAAIVKAAETLAVAFDKLAQQALGDDHLLALFGLTEAEERMARIDPGYPRLCVTSRLDAFVTDDGFYFLEYNAESPAGVADQLQLEKVLFRLPHNSEFLSRYKHWLAAPHVQLLEALLQTYRDWGGEEDSPQIAIVDWKGVATESEFRVLQEYFTAEGYESMIADPSDLAYKDGKLFAGDFRIDILYKRVVIHEFLTRCHQTHPLVRAYEDKRVCMANSFRSKVAHKKAGFAILSDDRYQRLFTEDERKTIKEHLPWTSVVQAGRVVFHQIECDLKELLRKERQRFVLKPNDDYGGHGVFLGWETSPTEWERAIEIALVQPYVVQERAPIKKVAMPSFTDRVQLDQLLIDFNPFLFNNKVEGALVRLSASSLLNVTSGGGQTALLVLEEM